MVFYKEVTDNLGMLRLNMFTAAALHETGVCSPLSSNPRCNRVSSSHYNEDIEAQKSNPKFYKLHFNNFKKLIKPDL